MKKLISFVLSIAMVLSLAAVPIQAADEKVDFGDQAFEDFMIMNFDRNGDKQITQSELEFNNEYVCISLSVDGYMDQVPEASHVMSYLQFGDKVNTYQ